MYVKSKNEKCDTPGRENGKLEAKGGIDQEIYTSEKV